MKYFLVVLIVIAVAIAGFFVIRGSYGNSTKNDNSAPVSTNSVSVKDMAFEPVNITVEVNSEIKFTNNDFSEHTITANDGKFNQTVSPGKTAQITINEVGTYDYHCSIHPSMKGSIIVQ